MESLHGDANGEIVEVTPAMLHGLTLEDPCQFNLDVSVVSVMAYFLQ
jgi:hypothetical protein